MPTSQELIAGLEQTYQNQLAALRSRKADAEKNAQVWNWGGSPEDQQHWNTVVGEVDAAINGLQNRYSGISQKLSSANIGPENTALLKEALVGGAPIALQRLDELYGGTLQLAKQEQQLSDFRKQFETQAFGAPGLSLSEALTSTGGDIGNLNQFLGQQQSRTFNEQLRPLIQMALGAQGLTDSGAAVELQSKALGQLEQTRQQSMMEAALGARNQLLGVTREDMLGNIGFQQQQMANQFDLGRTAVTMQFQRELEKQRADLARELAQRRGGNGSGGFLGMGLGAVIGGGLGAFGGPGMALLGAGLGGQLGGGIGNYMDPNDQYGSLAGAPSALFPLGSALENRRQAKSSGSAYSANPRLNYPRYGYGY